MSLDISLVELQPTQVYESNITHNLAKMAAQVKLEYKNKSYTLYDIVWHAPEHGFTKAHEIAELLYKGWEALVSNPEFYSQYKAPNGWGTYPQLVKFVHEYRCACWRNPLSSINISR
jgi:hypothetical protein